MSHRARIVLTLVGAFAFGVLAAWAKGLDTDGLSALSQVRSAIGNLSTPWLLVAFVAGTLTTRLWTGALLGLAATAAGLVGFYLLTSIFINVGGHNFPQNLPTEFFANRVYLEGGLISGPLFGALGAWWARKRSLKASFLAGAFLMCEPLVLAALGESSSGVLPWRSLPLVVRIIPRFGLSGSRPAIQTGVYAAEFLVGGIIVLAALIQTRKARRVDEG
jgi:hypothetical protein